MFNIDSKPKLNYEENDFYLELNDENTIIKIDYNIIEKLKDDLKGTKFIIGISSI